MDSHEPLSISFSKVDDEARRYILEPLNLQPQTKYTLWDIEQKLAWVRTNGNAEAEKRALEAYELIRQEIESWCHHVRPLFTEHQNNSISFDTDQNGKVTNFRVNPDSTQSDS